MQRVLHYLIVEASTKDGPAYSKKRLAAIVQHLEAEGFEVRFRRSLSK